VIASNRINPVAERDRALAEITRLEALAAEHPSSPRTAMLLDAERSHLRRVEATLAACGWEQS
jgi:hypothetical protein